VIIPIYSFFSSSVTTGIEPTRSRRITRAAWPALSSGKQQIGFSDMTSRHFMFVSFSLDGSQTPRLRLRRNAWFLLGRSEKGFEIKAGRDSPLIESRPASSLAVGIVWTGLYPCVQDESVLFRTYD
jgi:hypothetical protein